MRLIFATYNPGKLEEIQRLGQHFNVDVVGLEAVGVHLKTEETGVTFEENAKLKLQEAQAALANNTIDWIAADDSGLMIDALGGEPGIKSRRWNGQEMTDQEIIDYTLLRMKDLPPAQRSARFKSVVALGKVGQSPLVFEGDLEGSILMTPDITAPAVDGLPFRQLFFVSDISRVMGLADSLSPAERQNYQTHREKAFTKCFKYMNELSGLTGQFG